VESPAPTPLLAHFGSLYGDWVRSDVSEVHPVNVPTTPRGRRQLRRQLGLHSDQPSDTEPRSTWLSIEVVALDPFRGYSNGLLAQLGHASVVLLNHFHAVRLTNAAVNDRRWATGPQGRPAVWHLRAVADGR
jgi:hypothetical protein